MMIQFIKYIEMKGNMIFYIKYLKHCIAQLFHKLYLGYQENWHYLKDNILKMKEKGNINKIKIEIDRKNILK